MKNQTTLHIAKLVQRFHPTEQCPHKGNCLSEKEMLQKLEEIVKTFIRTQKEHSYTEGYTTGKKEERDRIIEICRDLKRVDDVNKGGGQYGHPETDFHIGYNQALFDIKTEIQ